MKLWRFVFILAGALLLYAGPAIAAPADKTSGPQLQIRETHFDFGQVAEGSVLEHAFVVLNRGDQPLLIENVSPS